MIADLNNLMLTLDKRLIRHRACFIHILTHKERNAKKTQFRLQGGSFNIKASSDNSVYGRFQEKNTFWGDVWALKQ